MHLPTGTNGKRQAGGAAGSDPPAGSGAYANPLFAAYVVFYAGFVLLNAFAPDLVQRKPFAGINLAVLYGLALIVAAFVIAVVYDWLCRRAASNPSRGDAAR